MWVEVLGPSGSGKNKIVEFLSERYEVLPDYVPKVGEPPLATHLGYLIKRFLNSSFANRNRMFCPLSDKSSNRGNTKRSNCR